MPLISGTVKDLLADRLSKGICLTISRAKELAKLEDWFIAESKGIQSNSKPELDLTTGEHSFIEIRRKRRRDAELLAKQEQGLRSKRKRNNEAEEGQSVKRQKRDDQPNLSGQKRKLQDKDVRLVKKEEKLDVHGQKRKLDDEAIHPAKKQKCEAARETLAPKPARPVNAKLPAVSQAKALSRPLPRMATNYFDQMQRKGFKPIPAEPPRIRIETYYPSGKKGIKTRPERPTPVKQQPSKGRSQPSVKKELQKPYFRAPTSKYRPPPSDEEIISIAAKSNAKSSNSEPPAGEPEKKISISTEAAFPAPVTRGVLFTLYNPLSDFMDHILQGLNDAQRSAVTSPSDVLQILAPPGSGKTKTLTARVAYLIQHAKYKPWDILCLTFTIKSSREMKERLSSLVGNGIEAKLILGTFHSVCRRYLVSYGHLVGIRRGFGIADSSDSLAMIKRIIKRMKLDIEPQVARSRISSSKSKGIGSAALTTETAKNKSVNQQDFPLVFEEYEKQLDQSNLLDYDDLLLRCVDLLKQYPSCVSNVEAVLIDEFQDTNVVQFDLMRLFAAYKKRVTTVGDPDQSIYGWRSAEVKNLRRMQQCYKDSLVVHLKENYRSSATILLAAQDIIEQDESRPNKTLSPTHCPGTAPVLRRLPSSEVEASWIVSEIQRSMALTGDLLGYADIAILLRSAALSRRIESAMGRAGIPYRMVGGQRFFDRVEIRLLLDYSRVVSQPSNNDALARIVVVPARGVGQTTVKSLLEEAESSKVALWSLIRNAMTGHTTTKTKINKPAEKGLGLLINLILTARQKLVSAVNPLSPKDLLEHIIAKLRFREYLEKAYEVDHENRWANVEELLSQASDYSIFSEKNLPVMVDNDTLPIIEGTEQTKGNIGEDALSKFLANVALAIDLQKTDRCDETQSQSQVTISTIHAAKGLEWPVVFIPSAYEGSIPHSRAEDTDEERRLLYVAMTRAQALLYISCPKKNSQREESSLSKFLMPKSLGCYLTNKGPWFDYATIDDISRILRRPMPSEFKIAEGFAKVKNLNDDLWPLNGDEEQEEEISRWDKNHEDC
ncbi:MAG: hypothetical protein Q9214_004979, partial [Letrouitia sp. 1 TL-2023]